jgi:hypothetical protein
MTSGIVERCASAEFMQVKVLKLAVYSSVSIAPLRQADGSIGNQTPGLKSLKQTTRQSDF